MIEETTEDIFELGKSVSKPAPPELKKQDTREKYLKVLNIKADTEQVMTSFALNELRKLMRNNFGKEYKTLYECNENGERIE